MKKIFLLLLLLWFGIYQGFCLDNDSLLVISKGKNQDSTHISKIEQQDSRTTVHYTNYRLKSSYSQFLIDNVVSSYSTTFSKTLFDTPTTEKCKGMIKNHINDIAKQEFISEDEIWNILCSKYNLLQASDDKNKKKFSKGLKKHVEEIPIKLTIPMTTKYNTSAEDDKIKGLSGIWQLLKRSSYQIVVATVLGLLIISVLIVYFVVKALQQLLRHVQKKKKNIPQEKKVKRQTDALPNATSQEDNSKPEIQTQSRNSEAELLQFSVDGFEGRVSIHGNRKEIELQVPKGVSDIQVQPSIFISPGATLTPQVEESNVSVSIEKPYSFEIKSEDLTQTAKWTILLKQMMSSDADVIAFSADGMKECKIDTNNSQIEVLFSHDVTLHQIAPQITVSQGAKHNFNRTLKLGINRFIITAEDNSTTKEWTIKVEQEIVPVETLYAEPPVDGGFEYVNTVHRHGTTFYIIEFEKGQNSGNFYLNPDPKNIQVAFRRKKGVFVGAYKNFEGITLDKAIKTSPENYGTVKQIGGVWKVEKYAYFDGFTK